MHRFPRYTILAAMILAGVAAIGQAATPPTSDESLASADIPHSAPMAASRFALQGATSGGIASAGVTDADVGDSDSFGRSLQWLGLTDMSVLLESDCSGVAPPAACQTLAPAPALTTFNFTNLGHVTLPANAANSLLCYWFSPVLNVSYSNPTASAVVARLNINPTLTVENPVLATPGLIDPTTGAPFGGSLLTGMTSSQHFQVPLPAGISISERKRDSAVCIAGFLSRKALVESYGLSDAQAKDFFKKPTTVRLNLSGSAQYVTNAAMYFGLRIIGD
ncbi:MAG: hypothetical protein E6K53_13415 [Gammaproteobacteria bacterium]|nr:MAG: hypothetical protein E6K53_13415 [Gammaproteobacteria bacterium]